MSSVQLDKVQKNIKRLKEAASFLQKTFAGGPPQVAITLGSGLGEFGNCLERPRTIPFSEIPHFLSPSIEGHSGELIVGRLGQVNVVAMKGRVHLYEGHELDDVCFATRAMALWGVKTLIVTNASGGINLNYRPGQLVLIKDHINLTGKNPLTGPNIAELGPRFPDMTRTYDSQLMSHFQNVGKRLGQDIPSGVYAWLNGPSYETPAEIRMLKVMGADLVGMSTVPEVIVARHMGLQVCGISCVTNMAAGIIDRPLSHDEVKEEAHKVRQFFSELLIQAISGHDFPTCPKGPVNK